MNDEDALGCACVKRSCGDQPESKAGQNSQNSGLNSRYLKSLSVSIWFHQLTLNNELNWFTTSAAVDFALAAVLPHAFLP